MNLISQLLASAVIVSGFIQFPLAKDIHRNLELEQQAITQTFNANQITTIEEWKTEYNQVDLDFVEYLGKCESSNDPTKRIVDNNGLYSTGKFMYQIETFKAFAKEYKIKDWNINFNNYEEADWINLMHESNYTERLTLEAIKQNPDNKKHWLNCYKKWLKLKK